MSDKTDIIRSSKMRRSHGQLAHFIMSLLLIRRKKRIRCNAGQKIGLRRTYVGVSQADFANCIYGCRSLP